MLGLLSERKKASPIQVKWPCSACVYYFIWGKRSLAPSPIMEKQRVA